MTGADCACCCCGRGLDRPRLASVNVGNGGEREWGLGDLKEGTGEPAVLRRA